MKRRFMAFAVVLFAFLGCSKQNPTTLQFRIAEDKPGPSLTKFVYEPTGVPFYLHEEAFISEADVDSAAVVMQDGHPVIAVQLTPEGSRKLALFTEQNVGKRCGMVLNQRLVTAPVIRDAIRGGRALITGDFSETEAQRIAQGLK